MPSTFVLKFEKLLKIGNELSKPPSEILSPSNIASAYTKMRTFLLPYGVKLSYRDFESEWTNMIKEEIRVCNRKICEIEGVESIADTSFGVECTYKYGYEKPND